MQCRIAEGGLLIISDMLYYTSIGRYVGCWVTCSWHRNWIDMSKSREGGEPDLACLLSCCQCLYNNHVHFDASSMIHRLCMISPAASKRSGGFMFKMALRSSGFFVLQHRKVGCLFIILSHPGSSVPWKCLYRTRDSEYNGRLWLFFRLYGMFGGLITVVPCKLLRRYMSGLFAKDNSSPCTCCNQLTFYY